MINVKSVEIDGENVRTDVFQMDKFDKQHLNDYLRDQYGDDEDYMQYIDDQELSNGVLILNYADNTEIFVQL